MKRVLVCLSMGILALLVMSGLEVQAQNAVANPFFTTMDTQHWAATDPSYNCVVNMNNGMEYYCLQKYPGSALNNGAIKQDVHLFAGNTYEFSVISLPSTALPEGASVTAASSPCASTGR